jgi:hypothetical protein
MIIDKEKEGELILKHILKVYSVGKFPLIKVIGHPGTGKSGFCIRLGELINKKIHGVEKMNTEDIIDNLEDLIKKVIDTKESEQKVVIIEEMSTLFNNRRFMQQENITANSVFDTMRKKKMIVIGNYPISKTVDTHIEKSFNCEIETLRLDKANKQYFCKAKILQTNPGTGKTYSHFFKDETGSDVSYFAFNWADKETFDKYDEGKDRFMNELYENLMLKAQKKKMENDKLRAVINGTAPLNVRKVLTEKQEEVLREMASGKNYGQIAKEKNVAVNSIQSSYRLAVMKGYSPDDFKVQEPLIV